MPANPTDPPRPSTGNVVRLAFRRRPAPASAIARSAPIALEASAGRWTLRGAEAGLDAAGLIAAADTLREIARALVERAHAAAGQPANRCLGEFVLYQDGGIDHWVAEAGDPADRRRLTLGLRNAIGSLRDGG